jgi:hypothetical protein
VKEYLIVFEQPNKPLSLNQIYTMHWAVRKRHFNPWVIALRIAYSKMLAREIELPVGAMNLEFTFTFEKNARRDPHNYIGTVKKLVDVLVDEGLVPDDTHEWISVAEPILRIDKDNLCLIKIRMRDENDDNTK